MTGTAQADVVFVLSTETWDDLVRREFARPPDRIVQHLRSSDRVDNLLIVQPWRSAAGQLRRRVGPHRDAAFPTTPEHRLLRPVRWRQKDPTDLAKLERSVRTYTRLIHATLRRRGVRRATLISVNPLVPAFGDLEGFDAVTYFARDDWAAYPPNRAMWPAYEAAYERMRQREIRTCAVSSALLDRLAPRGPSAVVPNGVDPQTWSNPGPPPSSVAALPRPWVVYTGTLDDRLSIPALEATMRAIETGSLILAGPPEAATVTRIRSVAPGVNIVPPLSQRDLAGLVYAADLSVIPHISSPLTGAMSPLKLYEYLAAGVPVVATDLPPMRGVDPTVILVRDGADFEAAVRRGLSEAGMSETMRLAFIAENSWSARCERVLEMAFR